MKHIFVFLIVLCVAGAANAAIIAQESFSYTAGQALQGQGSADSQWAGAWSGPAVEADMTIVSGGLSYNADGVVINGGATAVQVIDGTIAGFNSETRSLASNPTDSVLYIRFLMKSDTTSWSRDTACFRLTGIYGSGHKNIAELGYGDAAASPNNFTGDLQASKSANFGVPISSGDTHLVVAKLWVDSTLGVSADRYNTMDVWIDPNLAGTTGYVGTSVATATGFPGPGSIDGISLSRSSLEASDVVVFDEYVIGQTWGDVVVPEPTTMILMSIGGLAILRRRSR